MAIIKGQFTGRVFSNWNTLFHVHHFKTEKEKTIRAICKGNTVPEIGVDYIIQGNWNHSDIYGWQFFSNKIERAEIYAERHQANINQLQMALI